MVKKISDTNYSVRTPGRQTQVCHINMLKAYHDKTKPELVTLNNKLNLVTLNSKLRLESPTHSENCADLVGEKEEDNESEVWLGNDQQPIKLQNSQILNGLGTNCPIYPQLKENCYLNL